VMEHRLSTMIPVFIFHQRVGQTWVATTETELKIYTQVVVYNGDAVSLPISTYER